MSIVEDGECRVGMNVHRRAVAYIYRNVNDNTAIEYQETQP